MMDFLTSKKWRATFAAIMALVAGGLTGTMGWAEVIMGIVGALLTATMAQGVADHGKERAKIEAEAAAKSREELAESLPSA